MSFVRNFKNYTSTKFILKSPYHRFVKLKCKQRTSLNGDTFMTIKDPQLCLFFL